MQALDLETHFNNCITTTATLYQSLLLAPDCSLMREGPMTRQQAQSFFGQYRDTTHPLYILKQPEGYYAFY